MKGDPRRKEKRTRRPSPNCKKAGTNSLPSSPICLGSAKSARKRGRLEDAIREISPDWREDEIASFDCSIAAREKVQTFERMFADLEGEVRKTEGWMDAASRDLEDAREMIDRSTREIGEIGTRCPHPVRIWPPARLP